MASQSDIRGGERRAAAAERLARARAASAATLIVGAGDSRTADHKRMIATVLERTRAQLDSVADPRERLAAVRLVAVGQLSLDGVPVRDIASRLGIHPRHVVALRAELGVGRQR